jgi:hypothetical protein
MFRGAGHHTQYKSTRDENEKTIEGKIHENSLGGDMVHACYR